MAWLTFFPVATSVGVRGLAAGGGGVAAWATAGLAANLTASADSSTLSAGLLATAV